MTSSVNKSLLSKVKVVWKTLVVVILSVLLFAPTPALAFDNITLISHSFKIQQEIENVRKSIKILPSLSYENSKAFFVHIDNQLQKIKTESGQNAKKFQDLSNTYQQESEGLLTQIKDDKQPKIVLDANQETFLPNLTNGLSIPIIVNLSAEGQWNYSSKIIDSIGRMRVDANGSCFNIFGTTIVPADRNCLDINNYLSEIKPRLLFPEVRPAALVTLKKYLSTNKLVAFGKQQNYQILPNETVNFTQNDVPGQYSDNFGSQTISFTISDQDKFMVNNNQFFFKRIDNSITIKDLSYKDELNSKIETLSKKIASNNNMAKFYDLIERRIDLAKQKADNVREYADELKSLSDPDILSEINELDKFVVNLTTNIL
ncbi:hypothetical protein OGM63_23505 [Plectonema radiosum NIES-515]|uniref:Uncharacterized protein n=1 Tax=Plectonema radiosum NIES-515 TaxID=2986073 RepID=A0ABT3B4Y4_9CYAN|nr:hypothetical protein [Plectonema radiosum]MCV3216443.1 hypothetical protein [Plectonema radiosum NIES-515]